MAVIDLHTHILPGVDDGAPSIGESVAIARALLAAGTAIAIATPHVRDDFPTDVRAMEGLVADLRDALMIEDVPVQVLPGAEVALDHLPRLSTDELRRLTLAGTGTYLLVETPYFGWPLAFPQRVFELGLAGITTVIAHPERNPEVQRDPELLRPLVASGALVQLTASSLEGHMGSGARRTGQRLVELGLAHCVASDVHSPVGRSLDLVQAASAAGGPELSRWLTVDVPTAIASGRTPPARPPDSRQSRWPWRKRA